MAVAHRPRDADRFWQSRGMTNSGRSSHPGGSAPSWAVAIVVAVVAVYLAFLGWDQHADVDPETGARTGPYQPWQVLGVGVALILIAFVAGRAGRAVLVTAMLPLTLTACFVVDAATDPNADGLWVIGATLVAIGSLLGTGAVAAIGAASARAR